MAEQEESGFKSFVATSAVTIRHQVKLTSSSGTHVEHAGLGEVGIGTAQNTAAIGELVNVKLHDAPGTVKVRAHGAFAVGAALYSAAAGRYDDTSSGSQVGIALQAATAQDDVIEMLPLNAKPTTAGTVSITDAGGFTATATVEAAIQEIYQHLLGAQGFIPLPLSILRELSSGDVPAASAHGGTLAKDTTPIFETTNGDTDGAMRLNWAASNSDPVGFQVPLPPDLDVSSDLVIHFRGAMAGATDTPTIASDAYFNEGDTKVEDTSSALSSSVAENTITIAAADIPAGAQTLSVELTPGAHTTDALYIYALWIEYTRTILTA